MDNFKQWLLNIGYSEIEIENLTPKHLQILEDEYLGLLYGKD